MNTIKDSVTSNIKDLIQKLLSVGADIIKGEKEIDAIIAQIIELAKKIPKSSSQFTPNDAVVSARALVLNNSEITLSLTTEELIGSSKKALTNIQSLLVKSRVLSKLNEANGKKLTQAAKNVALMLCKMLEISKLSKTSQINKQIEDCSDNLNSSLSQYVEVLRLFPGGEGVSLEEDESFENKADLELKRAAKVIEDAANALMQIKPRSVVRMSNELLSKDDVNEAILATTRAITTATIGLINCAEVAQKERKESNSTGGKRFHFDPTWSNGLVSASQQVANSVKSLVNAANASVEGKSQQEALVASAHQVAQATAHLVAASKVKASVTSPAIFKLTESAKSVANSTSELVEAAAKAARFEDAEAEKEETFETVESAAGRVQEMELQMKILKIEAELEKERRYLTRMRQERYKSKK
eukprot:TRINITY_DN5918_c0_g1_i1.p1 TRINITY_DN5918_c0_g1~~TRINITY_DN5918_c0_g1_i1.p1  ORF type:complete len:473 (-),score=134.13 TRINITY_DN5918_c0_g1_i1:117-1364(-)